MPLHETDEDKKIIRIHKLLRETVGVEIMEEVSISKVTFVPKAEKIVVLPLEPLPPLEPNYVPEKCEPGGFCP
jgi:hypothetical protein